MLLSIANLSSIFGQSSSVKIGQAVLRPDVSKVIIPITMTGIDTVDGIGFGVRFDTDKLTLDTITSTVLDIDPVFRLLTAINVKSDTIQVAWIPEATNFLSFGNDETEILNLEFSIQNMTEGDTAQITFIEEDSTNINTIYREVFYSVTANEYTPEYTDGFIAYQDFDDLELVLGEVVSRVTSASEKACVPVQVNAGFEELTALSFGLDFDESLIAFDGFENELNASITAAASFADGNISFDWVSDTPTSLPVDAVLFEACFLANNITCKMVNGKLA